MPGVLTANSETLDFGAEISEVLDLVIHFLYTNKEIFLRELISNACDACDKLRYESLSSQKLMSSDNELKITISVDKENHKLFITDNGIGMNRQDLIDNLGTVARSGTKRFIDSFKKSKPEQAVELIGRFGVGFYSAFMVAEKVVVESRKAGEDEAWMWESDGKGKFTISKSESWKEAGTRIALLLKPEEYGFLDKFRIEQIVTTYSDHVNFAIEFINENGEIEKLNSKAAIWTRPKSEISAEEHQEFFRSVAHVGGEPWMILHNKTEGEIEYTNLLYIPSIKPFDLFHPDRRCSVKLYVNKVFVTEDSVQVIPQYLRFLKGIIDSSDLPLNISRETLQDNRIIKKINHSVVKRVISELGKKAKSDADSYAKFWTNFGAVLKEGLCEGTDAQQRESLLSVCRFYSTDSSEKEMTSLEDYLSRMKPEQKHIYYLTGSSLDSVKKSPQLEGFISRKIEVLLLTDPVDDFWTSVVTSYKNHEFKSVIRADQDLEEFNNENQEEKKEQSAADKEGESSVIEYFSKVLGGLVSSVRASKKLTGSPVCLAVADSDMDIRMERFLREQKQLGYKSPKILEINTKHEIIKKISNRHKEVDTEPMLEDMIHLLFNQACALEGEDFGDVSAFANRMNSLLAKLL